MLRDEFNNLKRWAALHEFLQFLTQGVKEGIFPSKDKVKHQYDGLIYDEYHGWEDPSGHGMRYRILMGNYEPIDSAFRRDEFTLYTTIYDDGKTGCVTLEIYNPDSVHDPLVFLIGELGGWNLEC